VAGRETVQAAKSLGEKHRDNTVHTESKSKSKFPLVFSWLGLKVASFIVESIIRVLSSTNVAEVLRCFLDILCIASSYNQISQLLHCSSPFRNMAHPKWETSYKP
jgi:hypothetical protein